LVQNKRLVAKVSKKKKKKKSIEPSLSPQVQATAPEVVLPLEKKKLYPRKLYPPPDVMRRMVEAEENKVEKNPLKRFFKKFFGEGY